MAATNTPTDSGANRRTTVSYCRVCPAACGIIVETAGQGPSAEYGLYLLERSCGTRDASACHRVDEPIMRTADGDLRPVSWDEALDDMAHGCGCRWASTVPQLLRTTSDPRGMTRPMPSLTACWPGWGAVIPWPMCPDYSNCDLLMLVGHNPVVSHGHSHRIDNPRVSLRNPRARGGTIVVVDPPVTETARLADIHVQLRPGGTPRCWPSWSIKRSPTGPSVSFSTPPAPPHSRRCGRWPCRRTRECVCAICDLDPGVLDRLWQLVETTPRIAMGCGTGVSSNAAGNAIEWLSVALLTATGSLDRHRGTIFSPRVLARPRGPPRPRHTPQAAIRDPGLGMACPPDPGRLAVRAFTRRNHGRLHPGAVRCRRQPAVVFSADQTTRPPKGGGAHRAEERWPPLGHVTSDHLSAEAPCFVGDQGRVLSPHR